MLAPVGGLGCIGPYARLVAVGILQQPEQPVDFGEVLVLRLLTRRLASKIAPQHFSAPVRVTELIMALAGSLLMRFSGGVIYILASTNV